MMLSRVDLCSRRRNLSVSSITKENDSSCAVDHVVPVVSSREEEVRLILPTHPGFDYHLVTIATKPYIAQDDIGLSVLGCEHFFENPNHVSITLQNRGDQQSPLDVCASPVQLPNLDPLRQHRDLVVGQDLIWQSDACAKRRIVEGLSLRRPDCVYQKRVD